MTTQPTCPTCGAVDRPACIEEFHFVPPSPDVSGDEDGILDDVNLVLRTLNEVQEPIPGAVFSGLRSIIQRIEARHARSGGQQTGKAIRALLAESSRYLSDENNAWSKDLRKRIADVLRGEK
jgi:hypothetical protein